MKKSLGGSMFIHNAVEFDYCISEALTSLCQVCDEVAVLDCQSTDNTLDVLRETAKRHGNLRVFDGGNWNCADNYARLAILADEAKSHLNTDWHLMLQADEVIHERSYQCIREAVQNRPGFTSFMVRRLNFFGDFNHYIKLEQPQENKPCSDEIVRLATIEASAHGDAETLRCDPARMSKEFLNKITLFHYGMVREDSKFITKIINMQSWFFGPGGQPDAIVVKMKESGTDIFDWRLMKTRDMLEKLSGSHPAFAQEWVNDRQAKKRLLVDG